MFFIYCLFSQLYKWKKKIESSLLGENSDSIFLEQIFNEVDNLDKEVVMDIIRSLVSIDTTIPQDGSKRFKLFLK